MKKPIYEASPNTDKGHYLVDIIDIDLVVTTAEWFKSELEEKLLPELIKHIKTI